MEQSHPPHVLIAEDDALLSQLLKHAVEQEGYTTTLATNGKETVELLKNESVDILLLDIMLPEMDGIAVLKAMDSKTIVRKIPVVVMSNLSDTTNVIQSLELGETPTEDSAETRSNTIPNVASTGMKTYLAKRLYAGVQDYCIKANFEPKQIVQRIREIVPIAHAK